MFSRLTDKLNRAAEDPEATLATAAIVTLAGLATRRVVTGTWRAVAGEDPPRDPSRPDVDWPTAITWTTAVGLTVSFARLFTRRAMHK